MLRSHSKPRFCDALAIEAAATLMQGGGGEESNDGPDTRLAPGLSCASLMDLQLTHGTVTATQEIAAGSYQPPSSSVAFADLDSAQDIALQRPSCPHPQHAVQTGSGDTSDAGNFICQ